MNSNRVYQIAIAEASNIYTYDVPLAALIAPDKQDNNFEYIYSLRDILDNVLDLKINESMYFQPNRDNKNTKAIILRRN